MKHISERELQLPEAQIGRLLKIAAEDKSIISLSVGEPDFITPKPLLSYAKTVIDKSTHYSPTSGIHELREAIVKKLKKDNKINLSPENIMVSCGSQQAIFTALLSTVDPGEQVIVPNPSYLAYIPAIDLVNATPIYFKLEQENNFEINPDKIKEVIDKKKSEVLIINTPSNPTGTVLSKKILEEIADIAVENDLYVFSDEAYEKLIYDKKHVSIGSLNGMQDYVVTFHTFSKSYAMCGFRLGFAAGPRKLIEAMSKRRNFLIKRLNEINLETRMPDGAFYAFSNIKNYSKNSNDFAEKILKKAKVAVVPGTEFGRYGEGFIRFSYAANYSLIETAVDRLERFLKRY